MEPLTLLTVMVGALVVVALGWVLIKFFFRLAKHLILAFIVGVVLMLLWYQPWHWGRPAKDPNIGKLAYIAGTDRFVGVVVGAEGNEWIVEKSGGYRTRYAKARLILKDK